MERNFVMRGRKGRAARPPLGTPRKEAVAAVLRRVAGRRYPGASARPAKTDRSVVAACCRPAVPWHHEVPISNPSLASHGRVICGRRLHPYTYGVAESSLFGGE